MEKLTEEQMKQLKIAHCPSKDYYIKHIDEYKDYDIVYHKIPNYMYVTHAIEIYKQPENISNWDLAFRIDGYFFDVTRIGNTLYCQYD